MSLFSEGTLLYVFAAVVALALIALLTFIMCRKDH